MIGRIVQRSEVIPVGFDLRTVGDFESDGTKDRLDPLPAAHDRMNTATTATATGQSDIEGFFVQTRIESCLRDGLAAIVQTLLDTLLGAVDTRTCGALLIGAQFAQPFEQFGDRTGLAQKARFGLFELGRIIERGKLTECLADDLVKLGLHAARNR